MYGSVVCQTELIFTFQTLNILEIITVWFWHFSKIWPKLWMLHSSDFLACRSTEDAPVIVFVSKMVAMDKKALPQNRSRYVTLFKPTARHYPLGTMLHRQECDTKGYLSCNTVDTYYYGFGVLILKYLRNIPRIAVQRMNNYSYDWQFNKHYLKFFFPFSKVTWLTGK